MTERARTRIQLCGGLSVAVDGEHVEQRLRGRQGRQLFAYLVVNRGRAVSRDELVDALWPDDPPERAGAALSTLLSHVRAALGADAVVGRSQIELVLPPGSWADVEAASEAIGRAQAAVARGEWKAAWGPANVAQSIAERGFLPGHDAAWIDVRRRDLEEMLLETLECVCAIGARLGGSELVAAERAARRLIELAPLRESGHVALMELQEARGNPSEGLRVYDDLMRRLREDLGAAPGRAAQSVHARLLDATSGAPAEVPAATRPEPQRAPIPLPALLELPQRAAFVNRTQEIARLVLALERASEVPRQLVLVAGEPGIGKTRFLTEFGRLAHGRGARVLFGRSDEDGLVPYGPFVEALRHHAAHASGTELERGAALGGDELRALLPELGETGGHVPPGTAALARYRLFDAVAALLADAARDHVVVLMLEDLHWADEQTLLLLKHVLRAAGPRRLLVLASFRSAELHRARALSEALASLQRDVPVDRIPLRGLARPDTAALARESSAADPDDDVVASIHAETDGNPFFVLELARHLADEGGSRTTLPDGVRETIRRRVSQLADGAQTALRVAGALGREFDADLLEASVDSGTDAVLDALDEAVAAGLLTEAAEPVGRYAFSHALTRTVLYDELTAARRTRVHERIAAALLERLEAGRPVRRAEIAAHMLAALPRTDADRAIDEARAAAAEANDLLAYEDAAAHLAAAVGVAEQHRSGDVRRRASLLLELGHAQRRSGRMPEARTTFARAIDAARELGDRELMARAVLGYGGGFFESAFLDETMVALLEEALAGIGEGDGPLRLELLSRLAKALYYSEEEDDEQRREALSSEALAMAERLGETSALLIALEGRHFALTRPENLDERLSTARRIIALAHECGDAERDLLGRYFLISDLVEGDAMEEADAELEEYGRRARAARLALHLWYHARFRAMRALLRGRLEEAAGLAQEAYELGLPVEPRTATMHFGAQMWLLNHLQRSLAPLEEAVRSFVADYPRVAAWRMGLAHVLLEQGRRDEAAAVFQEFRAERFRNIPRDAIWGVTTALAAELVAAGLGGRSDGRALYDLMRPYADRNAVTGETIFCSGPMAYYAGLMARAIGDEQEAHELLESALGRARSMGAEPYVERAAAALRESGRHAA